MKNFLKYLTFIPFIAPFSQESIAKPEDAVVGTQNELGEEGHENHLNLSKDGIQGASPKVFVDAHGNLIDPALEERLLQVLDETKGSPVAKVDSVKDLNNLASDEMPASPVQDETSSPLVPDETPFSPEMESVPSSSELGGTIAPIPAEVEEPLPPEIEDVPSFSAVDDIPTPLPLPLPPEDEASTPNIGEPPLAIHDEAALSGPVNSVPSPSEVEETTKPSTAVPPVRNEAPSLPSLEIEDTPLVPAADEPPLLSPSEAAELAATIERESISPIEDEMRPSSPEVVQPSPVADVDMGAASTADSGNTSAAGSGMMLPADASEAPKEQDAQEAVRLQVQEQEDKKIAAQREFQAKALQQAQQRQLDQYLDKQEEIDLRERERALQKQTYSQASMLDSAPKEQQSSAVLTDEHGNFIQKDELKVEAQSQAAQLID